MQYSQHTFYQYINVVYSLNSSMKRLSLRLSALLGTFFLFGSQVLLQAPARADVYTDCIASNGRRKCTLIMLYTMPCFTIRNWEVDRQALTSKEDPGKPISYVEYTALIMKGALTDSNTPVSFAANLARGPFFETALGEFLEKECPEAKMYSSQLAAMLQDLDNPKRGVQEKFTFEIFSSDHLFGQHIRQSNPGIESRLGPLNAEAIKEARIGHCLVALKLGPSTDRKEEEKRYCKNLLLENNVKPW